MKAQLTPIPYPTTDEEGYKWGFDIYKPEGTPMAWIADWTSPGPGWGALPQRIMDILQFKVDDLSQVSADDMMAVLSTMLKSTYSGFWNAMQNNIGAAKTSEICRQMGYGGGQMNWIALQAVYGSPVPLERIIWYQDLFHMLCGPTMRPYSWCDGKKAIVTRTECTNKPIQGMEECAQHCRVMDTASNEGYMAAEPDLLVVRTPDIGDRSEEPRCVHLFTYIKEKVEELPDELKRRIPDTTAEVLKVKGVHL
ncbi:hypothetical protein ACFLWX_04665 [Chloroflexota bacterium]